MVNGTSLGPLFDNPHGPIRFENGVNAAFSQFMKVSAWNVLNGFQRNATKIAGYSIRVDRWRYSEWFAMDVVCTSSGASYPDRGPHAGPDRVSERPQETQHANHAHQTIDRVAQVRRYELQQRVPRHRADHVNEETIGLGLQRTHKP